MADIVDYELPAKSGKGYGELGKWVTEVNLAEREQETYIERADRVVKRYRDEDRKERNSDANLPARFNVLWSNTETEGPALYAHTPKVECNRRFKDQDPIGRSACQILERCSQFSIDNYDFSGLMRAVLKDFQLAGRGTAWARYEPSVNDQGIAYQEVTADHVHYRDFLHSASKQWRNVRWVARKIYLNRRQLKQRFSKIGSDIPLDYSPRSQEDGEGRKTEDQSDFKQARIYEIWDSDKMEVIWLSKSYKGGLLDKVEDPLGLHDFFPTPKPLFGVTTTDTLIPIPAYCLYQDQARELDMLTMKIALLEDALRMVGFFDASYANDLGKLFTNCRQNEMIPIANWQKLQAAGGIKGVAEWMEIGQIIEAITALYNVRAQVKQDLYEITGLSDVIRGNSDPSETATAQQIKGQFATLRLSDKQREVQRYARDLIAIHAEIIAEHFEPGIIAAMADVQVTSPDVQQQFEEALQLLKSDPMRSFRISIETDSMIAVDEALDKQKTTEFVQAFGGLLQSSMQALQMAPILAPVLGEVMLFTIRRFNGGRQLEASIEQGMQGLIQMAQQAMSQPPAQDPNMIKVQGQLQLEQTKSQNDFTLKQAELEQKTKMHAMEMQGRMQLESQKAQESAAVQREKITGEAQLAALKAERELELKTREIQLHDQLETKKALLGSKIDKLHISADGAITTHPTIIKTGKFSFDPATGERMVTVVERPIGGHALEDATEEPLATIKSGRVRTDPLTGDRTIEMIEAPVQAGQTGAQTV